MSYLDKIVYMNTRDGMKLCVINQEKSCTPISICKGCSREASERMILSSRTVQGNSSHMICTDLLREYTPEQVLAILPRGTK